MAYSNNNNSYEYLKKINSIPSSKDASVICNSLDCTDTTIISYASVYSIIYKDIFNGIDTSLIARQLLNNIKCDVKPQNNIKTYKSIIHIKEILANYKNNAIKFDIKFAEYVGTLAGLIYYFDELDENNTKIYNMNTNNVRDICKPADMSHL